MRWQWLCRTLSTTTSCSRHSSCHLLRSEEQFPPTMHCIFEFLKEQFPPTMNYIFEFLKATRLQRAVRVAQYPPAIATRGLALKSRGGTLG